LQEKCPPQSGGAHLDGIVQPVLVWENGRKTDDDDDDE